MNRSKNCKKLLETMDIRNKTDDFLGKENMKNHPRKNHRRVISEGL
jgi:hypothetical protein